MLPVTLDMLFALAERLGARIDYANLHARHPQLEAYTRGRVITLDKSLIRRPRQLRCILSEEIGHVIYPPWPGHLTYHIAECWSDLEYTARGNLAVLVNKDERSAIAFATELLIPDSAFWDFANTGPHEWQEWLDYFWVELWFMEMKIGLMQEKQRPHRQLYQELVIRR